MAVFYDPHVDDERIDWAVGREVSGYIDSLPSLGDGRQLSQSTLAAVPEMASWIHRGPFLSLFEAYNTIGQWVEAHGYRLAGDSREIFLALEGKPEDFITEVQFPIAH